MSFAEQDFSDWLLRNKALLEQACGRATEEGFVGLNAQQLDAANKSLSNLYADTSAGIPLSGGDCDYSLKGVGPLYTGHYHGKRVHDALAVLTACRSYFLNEPYRILDVGSGTGAVLWAWALIAVFSEKCGFTPPKHTWLSIDSSQEMTDHNSRLWSQFVAVFPGVEKLVQRETPLVVDWRSQSVPSADIVLGSYLFSRRESDDSTRTAREFADFLQRTGAFGILIWIKPTKRKTFDSLRNELKSWTNSDPPTLYKCPLRGRMQACLEIAKKTFTARKLPVDDAWDRHFNWGKAPTDVDVCLMGRKKRH